MNRLLKVLGLGVMLLACFGFGFAWRDLRHGNVPTGAFDRLLASFTSKPPQSAEQMFRDSYNKILADYERPLKARELKYAGIEGMMASLGDPHTMFLEPRDAEEFAIETKANIVGVGARLIEDPLGAKANKVFETGPAYAAGMRDDDVITGVDGKAVAGKKLEDIVSNIKGKEGTTVHLQIVREKTAKPISLEIKRAQVIIPTVESKYLDRSGIGVLTVSSFSEPTAEQFDEHLARLEKHDLKGLVIDMRGNLGGLLESAREMLSRFVENKLVVKMKFRDGTEEVAKTYPGYVHSFPYPVVVLVNEDSASAAEIFSGALRDYRLAILIGEHTYGKASVQNVFPLIDGSSAKVTIARYFLPMTGDISRKVDDDGQYLSGGLEPDIKVDIEGMNDISFGKPEKDPQLAKAVDYILSHQR